MTLDDLFAEFVDRGYYLHYLRGYELTIWEACLVKPLEQKVNGCVNAVGYGQSRIGPAEALAYAIEAIEKDPHLETHEYKPAENNIDLPSAHDDIMSVIFQSDQPALFKRRAIS
jgi:hypothetical protein